MSVNLRGCDRQIQKKFKHAADFGISGNYNLQTAAAFAEAIQTHVQKQECRKLRVLIAGHQSSTTLTLRLRRKLRRSF
ncbi:colicin D domain-containing protein [Microcoleus sp. bin48.metabat.b7b8b9.023]|uniref:colicin D domain-containing protein n=1 Tax=unclassified Microcoleus TaxID=2642155 RepID=UPI00345439E1